MVKASEQRKEIASSGIYFLFGIDDNTGNPLVYIGEAENIIYRLKQHLNDKDYRNEVIAFINKDDDNVLISDLSVTDGLRKTVEELSSESVITYEVIGHSVPGNYVYSSRWRLSNH